MCSRWINNVEVVWDCDYSREMTCGWKCEVCGGHAGGSIRYFDSNGDSIDPREAREMIGDNSGKEV